MPKLRWDCNRSGCFNQKRRPKIEEFDDCFPGSIAFGDVDAIVEIDSRALMLEWKGDGGQVKGGQDIMYCRMTKKFDVVVCVVHGDAETMIVEDFCFYVNGNKSKTYKGGLFDLKRQIRRWVQKTRPDRLPIDDTLDWLKEYSDAADGKIQCREPQKKVSKS